MRQSFGPADVVREGRGSLRGGLVMDEDWDSPGTNEAIARTFSSRRVPIGVMREDVVESESSPGTYYHLTLKNDGTWRCDCPGYTYRQDCKHARRKMEEMTW